MPNRVYLGRLSIDARERDIENFFKGYGHLRSILIKENFAFIEFENYRDADDAVYELNGKSLCGERVIVEHSRDTSNRGYGGRSYGRNSNRSNGRSFGRGGGGGYGGGGYGGGGMFGRAPQRSGRAPERTKYRVIVENLSTRCSWQDLKDYVRKAGEVRFADAHRNREGEGVVEFATEKDMNSAIEKLDGTELKGRKIRLIPPRKMSRSRSRSDSRSRSRSNSSRSKSRSKHRSSSNRRGSNSVSRDRSRSNDSRSWRKNVRAKSKDKSSSRSVSPKENELDTGVIDKVGRNKKSKTKSLDGNELEEKSIQNITRGGSVSDSDANHINKLDEDYKKGSLKYKNNDNFSSDEDDKYKSINNKQKASKSESEDDKYKEKSYELQSKEKNYSNDDDDDFELNKSTDKEKTVKTNENTNLNEDSISSDKSFNEKKGHKSEKDEKHKNKYDSIKGYNKNSSEERYRDTNKELTSKQKKSSNFKNKICRNDETDSISSNEERVSFYKSKNEYSDDEYQYKENYKKAYKQKDTNYEIKSTNKPFLDKSRDKSYDSVIDNEKSMIEEKSRDKNKELLSEKKVDKSLKKDKHTNKDHESISTDEESISNYKSDKDACRNKSKKMHEIFKHRKNSDDNEDDDVYYYKESSKKTCKPMDSKYEEKMESTMLSHKSFYDEDKQKVDNKFTELSTDKKNIESIEFLNKQAEISIASMHEEIYKSANSSLEKFDMNQRSAIKSPENSYKELLPIHDQFDQKNSQSNMTEFKVEEKIKGSDKYDPLVFSDDSDEVTASKKSRMDLNESETSLYKSMNESLKSSCEDFMTPNNSEAMKMETSLDSSQNSQMEDSGKKSRRARKAKSPPKELSPEKSEGLKRSLRSRAKAEVIETQAPSRKRK